MIWNKDILFLHVPKTGGMSVTEFLLTELRGSVSYTADTKHPAGKRANFVKGKRHETLADAESFFTYRNQSIYDFEAVFAVMRNPYDLEVSRYHYLRQGLKVDRGPAQDLALAGDYQAYLRHAAFFGANPPRLDRYYQLGGTIPPNMRILRNEHLQADLTTQLAPYLSKRKRRELPRVNASVHESWTDYYDETTEQLCYQRHRWFFDLGFYHRHLPAYAYLDEPAPEPESEPDPKPEPEPDPTPEPEALPRFPEDIPKELLKGGGLGPDSLPRRGADFQDRLMGALGVEDLSGVRLLDIGCGAVFGRRFAVARRRVGAYLGLDEEGPLLDLLREQVHDPRLRYGALRIDGGFVTAAIDHDEAGVGSGIFDVVWSARLFKEFAPADFVAALRFCRARVTDDATMVISVNLTELSDEGGGLFAWLLKRGLPEEYHDHDELGPTEHGDRLYSRARVVEFLDASGWELADVLPPSRGLGHLLVLKPVA